MCNKIFSSKEKVSEHKNKYLSTGWKYSCDGRGFDDGGNFKRHELALHNWIILLIVRDVVIWLPKKIVGKDTLLISARDKIIKEINRISKCVLNIFSMYNVYYIIHPNYSNTL